MRKNKILSVILALVVACLCTVGLAGCKKGMTSKKAMEFVKETVTDGNDLKNSIEYEYEVTSYVPAITGEENTYQKETKTTVRYILNRIKKSGEVQYYIYGICSTIAYETELIEEVLTVKEVPVSKIEVEYFPVNREITEETEGETSESLVRKIKTEIRVGITSYEEDGTAKVSATKYESEKSVLDYRKLILNTIMLCKNDDIVDAEANLADPALAEEGTKNLLMNGLYVPKMLPTDEAEILPDEQERSVAYSATIIFKDSTSEVLKNTPTTNTFVSRDGKATYFLSYTIMNVSVENVKLTETDDYQDIKIAFKYSDTKEALEHKIEV